MKSLLLADDEVAISSAFAKTLEGFGYRVELSQTLESALRSAAQGHFDAILVEFNLRSELGSRYRAGNGLQLVRKLRAAQVKVPIVVFTAMESSDSNAQVVPGGSCPARRSISRWCHWQTATRCARCCAKRPARARRWQSTFFRTVRDARFSSTLERRACEEFR